jgi:outer membrane protein OmpA-like peptidoglycan-associated protein
MASPETYLTEPFLKFPKAAVRAKRLIGFDTGKFDLKPEHQGWLVEAAHAIPEDRNFRIYIFGYASKLGYGGQTERESDALNVQLSFDRASRAASRLYYTSGRGGRFLFGSPVEGNAGKV